MVSNTCWKAVLVLAWASCLEYWQYQLANPTMSAWPLSPQPTQKQSNPNYLSDIIYHLGCRRQVRHWWQIWTSTAIWSRGAWAHKMSFPSPSGWWEFQLHPGQVKHHAQDLSSVSKETNTRVRNIWKWRVQASKSQSFYLFFSVATPLFGHGQHLWAFKAVLGSRETPRLWATISPKEADLKT